MRKWLVLVAFLVLAVFSYWVWSLSALPEERVNQFTISEIEGDVQIKRGDNEWVQAQNASALSVDDQVKTGANSRASLNWFEKGQTRVTANSLLRIDTASQAQLGDKTQIHVTLERGRLWSRLLRLFDLESNVSIQTNDAIATIRGTAFDIEKVSSTSETSIWVSDSVVDVKDVKVPAGMNIGLWSVPEGEMIAIGGAKKTTSTAPISDTAKKGEWMQTNQANDVRLLQRLKQQLSDSLRIENYAGEGLKNTLVVFSQNLRLKFSGNDQELRIRYLLRELAWIRDCIDKGKEGSALQQFTGFEQRIAQLAKEPNQKSLIRLALKRGTVLFEELDPDSPAFRIRQRLEDLIVDQAESPQEQLFDQVSFANARLNEANDWIAKDDVERASISTEAAENAFANLERDQKNVSDLATAFIRYRESQRVRLVAMQARLKLALSEPIPDLIVAVAPTFKTVSSTLDVATTTIPLVDCVSIDLRATQTELMSGSSTKLTVTATMSDQSQLDVTSKTTFILKTLKLGTLKRNLFTAKDGGMAVIEAKLECTEGQKTAQVSLEITAAPIVEEQKEPTPPVITTPPPETASTSSEQAPNLTNIYFKEQTVTSTQ